MLEKIKMTLRRADEKDIAGLIDLYQDPEALFNLFGMTAAEKDSLSQIITAILDKSYRTPPDELLLVAEGASPLGVIYLSGIDWVHRNLFISFAVKKEIRNSIYGVKIIAEAIRFSFEELNMHKVSGHIHEENIKMKRILENFGGIIEGLLGNFIVKDGRRLAAYRYAFFKRDYPVLLERLKSY